MEEFFRLNGQYLLILKGGISAQKVDKNVWVTQSICLNLASQTGIQTHYYSKGLTRDDKSPNRTVVHLRQKLS